MRDLNRFYSLLGSVRCYVAIEVVVVVVKKHCPFVVKEVEEVVTWSAGSIGGTSANDRYGLIVENTCAGIGIVRGIH